MHMPLVLTNRRRRGGSASAPAFSPSSLYSSGSQGIWLDPSDLTTMFSDRAGTTAVTTPGTVVGLRLDKSKGLVLGSASTASSWTNSASAWDVFSSTGGAFTAEKTTAGGTDLAYSNTFPFVLGNWYEVSINVTSTTLSSYLVHLTATTNGRSTIATLSGAGVKTALIQANVSSGNFSLAVSTTSNGSISVTSVSVRELAGNHAVAPTDAARPTYGIEPKGGRRNVANGSGAVGNNAYWLTGVTQNGVTSTKTGSGTDVDGLPYADIRLQGTATSTFYNQLYLEVASRSAAAAGETWTSSVLVKRVSGGTSGVAGLFNTCVERNSGGTLVAQSASSSYNGTAEQLLSIARLFTDATTTLAATAISLEMTNGATIDVTYRIKALQFEKASARSAFQLNLNAYDVTESGVATCHYVQYDGSDDSLSTSAIDFTGTDKMSVFAGVRKLSDAAAGIFAELSADSNANAGSFLLTAPNSNGTSTYGSGSRGTATFSGALSSTSSGNAAPISSVIATTHSIVGALTTLRVNAVAAANATGNKGSGNFGNYPLFFGRRNNATLPFNGKDYGLIVVGKTASAGEITDTETWLAARTSGVSL